MISSPYHGDRATLTENVMAKQKARKGHEWMRAQEAAKQLGVTRPTVLAMIARDELRSLAVGGLVFVNRADVEARAAKEAA